MGWLARLLSGGRAEPPAAAPATAAPPLKAAAAAAPIAASAAAPLALAALAALAPPPMLLPWLLHCQAVADKAFTRNEQRALEAIDKALALPGLPDELLPRSAALIPQLLAMLRQTDLPVPALAQRVAKDVVLAAEVLRLASSPYYRAQAAVTDLAQAIALIGEHGLQTVIARVVLKPMYEAPPATLSARAAPRLWEHAEALAAQASALAAVAGEQPFDGYLAGLLHGTGWSVALRIIDRAGLTLSLPPSAAFAAGCEERAHRLFGAAAQRWAITPAFSAFGADARLRPLSASKNALASSVLLAQPLAMADLAPA